MSRGVNRLLTFFVKRAVAIGVKNGYRPTKKAPLERRASISIQYSNFYFNLRPVLKGVNESVGFDRYPIQKGVPKFLVKNLNWFLKGAKPGSVSNDALVL